MWSGLRELRTVDFPELAKNARLRIPTYFALCHRSTNQTRSIRLSSFFDTLHSSWSHRNRIVTETSTARNYNSALKVFATYIHPRCLDDNCGLIVNISDIVSSLHTALDCLNLRVHHMSDLKFDSLSTPDSLGRYLYVGSESPLPRGVLCKSLGKVCRWVWGVLQSLPNTRPSSNWFCNSIQAPKSPTLS